MESSRPPEEIIPLISLRRADEAIGVVALLVIVFSILWGVVSRYVFPQPAAWTYELAMMAFASLRFRGVPWMFMAASTITLLAAFVMLRVAA